MWCTFPSIACLYLYNLLYLPESRSGISNVYNFKFVYVRVQCQCFEPIKFVYLLFDFLKNFIGLNQIIFLKNKQVIDIFISRP